MITKINLFFIFACLPLFIFSQNLIPNSDFEAVNLCQQYQESCFPKGWKSTSLKLAQYQNAKDPTANKSLRLLHFDGARAFDRRFIQTQLLAPIEAGKQYEISFQYGTTFLQAHTLGFLFTDDFYFDKNNVKLSGHEGVMEVPLKIGTDSDYWVRHSIQFTATKNASHLIIGNFNNDEQTALYPLDKKASKKLKKSYAPQNRILFELDNIKLEPVGFKIEMDRGAAEAEIYFDNIRHAFTVKKIEDLPQVVEVDLELEENPVLIGIPEIAAALHPGLNTLRGIEFEFGTTKLTEASIPNLAPILNYLRDQPQAKLLILGHTDNVGSDLDNLNLSKDRAAVINDYLVDQGISANRLSHRGLGATRPIAENTTEIGRQKNRRVEVEIK